MSAWLRDAGTRSHSRSHPDPSACSTIGPGAASPAPSADRKPPPGLAGQPRPGQGRNRKLSKTPVGGSMFEAERSPRRGQQLCGYAPRTEPASASLSAFVSTLPARAVFPVMGPTRDQASPEARGDNGQDDSQALTHGDAHRPSSTRRRATGAGRWAGAALHGLAVSCQVSLVQANNHQTLF